MSKDTSVSREAAALARRGARKGGLARAARLDDETRREIALRAAIARWGDVHVATHVGELRIGNRTLECAVLEDGTRVINQTTVLAALGRHTEKSRRGDPGAKRAPFLAAGNLQPFISDELREMMEPVAYRLPGGSGRAWGYRADALPMVCEVYLEARELKALAPSQGPVAAAAEVLVRGLARVGIIALVDECTGYQETRARYELQRILERYVQAEFRPWIKTFPDEFFQEVYRLQGWEFKPGTSKRTQLVGRLVNKYIYEQLPPGVHEELRRLNPRTQKGHRLYKHHQFLTVDTGSKHLDRQIATVTTLMRISDSKEQFEELFERAFPPMQPRLPLVVEVSDKTED